MSDEVKIANTRYESNAGYLVAKLRDNDIKAYFRSDEKTYNIYISSSDEFEIATRIIRETEMDEIAVVKVT